MFGIAFCGIVICNIVAAQSQETVNKRSILHAASLIPNRTICGLDNVQKRIFSGEMTQMKEFPWMAAVEFRDRTTKENVGVKCGGSILNNRFVLTAAHCILDPNFEIVNVRLGEWNVSSNPDCHVFQGIRECADEVKVISIQEEIIYPRYSPISDFHDIGLLFLNEEIPFSEYIVPICLPSPDQPEPKVQSRMTVAGWGLTEHGYTSPVKLKVEVPLMSISDCRGKLRSKSITRNHLCVGGEKGKDSCKGDSGGPLMNLFPDNDVGNSQWYQEGVVSWGRGCGVEGLPAIYTKVSEYRDWIMDTIINRLTEPTSVPSTPSVPIQSKLQDPSEKIYFYNEETGNFE